MKRAAFILTLLFVAPAWAATFCHTETGQCLDPQPNDTIGHYLARYDAQASTGWQVVKVPDATAHNAVVNGDGTFANPDGSTVNADGSVTPAPPPKVQPVGP